MRRIAPLVLLALLLSGCFGAERDWVYPGKGWAIEVEHYAQPDRLYRKDAPGNLYYTPNPGQKILALWVTVTNLDDEFSYNLRDEVSSWRVADELGNWANLPIRNYEYVDALQTQLGFKYGEPRSGYLYFVVHDSFDISSAILEFRYYGMGQGHHVVVPLGDVQPLSNTM